MYKGLPLLNVPLLCVKANLVHVCHKEIQNAYVSLPTRLQIKVSQGYV